MNSKFSYQDLDEWIRSYINGTLSQEEIDKLWSELIRNPEFMEYFRTSVNMYAVAREENHASEAANQFFNKSVWPRLMAAAVLIVAVAAGTFLWYQQQVISEVPRAVDRIEIDIMRSTAEVPTGDEQPLQQALMLIAEQQIDEAVNLLDSLSEKSENAELMTEASLTKAVIDYNDSRFQEARQTFKEILEYEVISNGQKERVHWYLAQTLIQLQEYDQAREHADRVVDMDGAYYRAASQMLEQF